MTRLGRLGELAAWAISFLAFVISFETQASLAQSTGAFPVVMAWVWPATVDLASLVAMVLALDSARSGRSARAAWGIAVLAALVMMAANVVGSWPNAIAMGLHAWPPAIALACWITLVHDRRRSLGARAMAGDSPRQHSPAGSALTPRPRPPAQRRKGKGTRGGWNRTPREPAFAVIAEHDGELSGRKLGRLIGVSQPTGTRLLNEWRAQQNGKVKHA